MSTVNEQIVTGRAHRVLIDKINKLWQKISFWTKASDVEFNDGNTAETKVGAINGITDSLSATNSNVALSAKAGASLNAALGGLSFVIFTQAQYNALGSKDANTLYVIVG